MDMPFEFCALTFFLQWERKEKSLHAQMKSKPSLADIRSALKHFQVARNFAGLKQDDRAQSIVDSLASVDSNRALSAKEKVVQLATEFKGEFKQFNLSAASKLLWLKHRKPYIIYDSRAVTALHKMGHRFEKKSYTEYCQNWRQEYRHHRKNVQNASANLVNMRSFFPAWHADSESMSTLFGQPWFLERVFDIYLWEMGGDG